MRDVTGRVGGEKRLDPTCFVHHNFADGGQSGRNNLTKNKLRSHIFLFYKVYIVLIVVIILFTDNDDTL
jgi:hypothetical protein